MLGRDSQAALVRQCPDRRGTKDGPLLVEIADEPVGDASDFFAAKNADQVVDAGPLDQQVFLLPFSQATGDDHSPRAALLFESQHLVDRGERFGPRPLDESARVDDDEIGPVGLAHQFVAIELQEAQHSLTIDQIFWATEADEGVGAFRFGSGHFRAFLC